MKFDVLQIISDHIGTLYDAQYKKFKFDYLNAFLMYGVPILSVFGIYLSSFSKHEEVLDTIVISLSIFVGLLLNLFVLVYNITEQEDDSETVKEKKLERIRKDVLIELCQNISYAILISVISIILFLGTIFFDGTFQIITIYIIYFLFLNFTFTMLMIIKRTHILLVKKENHSKSKSQSSL